MSANMNSLSMSTLKLCVVATTFLSVLAQAAVVQAIQVQNGAKIVFFDSFERATPGTDIRERVPDVGQPWDERIFDTGFTSTTRTILFAYAPAPANHGEYFLEVFRSAAGGNPDPAVARFPLQSHGTLTSRFAFRIRRAGGEFAAQAMLRGDKGSKDIGGMIIRAGGEVLLDVPGRPAIGVSVTDTLWHTALVTYDLDGNSVSLSVDGSAPVAGNPYHPIGADAWVFRGVDDGSQVDYDAVGPVGEVAGGAARASGSDIAALPIGSRLQLAVAPQWIERMDGVELRRHAPQPREVAIHRSGGNAYMTVLKDHEVYRMYYRYTVPGRDSDGHEFTCYAESRDGITWTKPDLGLFEIPGTEERNAITEENKVHPGDDDPGYFPCISHNLRPFLDTRPGVPDNERFKALGAGFNSSKRPAGYVALVSGDGIHWRKLQQGRVIDRSNWPHGSDSTPACVFWSEAEQRYVAYIRIRVDRSQATSGQAGGLRWIGRITSDDFLNWSKVKPMRSLEASGPDPGTIAGRKMHYYTNETQPYFRNPHLYVATPARFFEGSAFTQDQLKRLPEEMNEFPPNAKGGGYTDAMLFTARPGQFSYRRPFAEAFLRPGLDVRNWGNRSTYPNVNLVPTGAGEMSFYVRHGVSSYGFIQRYSLRTDGFASIRAPLAGGEFLTWPLEFAGRELVINYSTSGAGSIRVELQEPGGKAIDGFSLSDASRHVGDAIEQVVTWKSSADVSRLAGKPVRLRLVMHDADLFSFRFR